MIRWKDANTLMQEATKHWFSGVYFESYEEFCFYCLARLAGHKIERNTEVMPCYKLCEDDFGNPYYKRYSYRYDFLLDDEVRIEVKSSSFIDKNGNWKDNLKSKDGFGSVAFYRQRIAESMNVFTLTEIDLKSGMHLVSSLLAQSFDVSSCRGNDVISKCRCWYRHFSDRYADAIDIILSTQRSKEEVESVMMSAFDRINAHYSSPLIGLENNKFTIL